MIVTVSQMEAITEAAQARRDMRDAEQRWVEAVDRAVAAGASLRAIAKASGMSDSAVRMHRKRRGANPTRGNMRSTKSSNRGRLGNTNGAAEGTPTSLSAAPNPPLSLNETEG